MWRVCLDEWVDESVSISQELAMSASVGCNQSQ